MWACVSLKRRPLKEQYMFNTSKGKKTAISRVENSHLSDATHSQIESYVDWAKK